MYGKQRILALDKMRIIWYTVLGLQRGALSVRLIGLFLCTAGFVQTVPFVRFPDDSFRLPIAFFEILWYTVRESGRKGRFYAVRSDTAGAFDTYEARRISEYRC
ncbi:MAG: hypothetical protein J5753_07825, partial [Oscillospiraceae bacterium]|nr:hypothetical protein [Oscillospiraceae bacterium]